MKDVAYISFFLFLLITLFEACDRQALAPKYQGKLVASSTGVCPNEADALIVDITQHDDDQQCLSQTSTVHPQLTIPYYQDTGPPNVIC